MLMPIMIGLALGITCMACHAIGTTWWLKRSTLPLGRLSREAGTFSSMLVLLGSTITLLTLLHVVEITLWALSYRWLTDSSAFHDFEESVYFSFVTFTTVGYGDILMEKHWRIMAGIQALNGIMLLGWSTAILMAMAQKIWQTSHQSQELFSGKN